MITRHYVPANRELSVQEGQRVEEGQALCEGVLSPADVVQHRGIGAGRRHFVDTMRQAFDDNGLKVNRRNLEVLARGVVRHATIDDPDGVGPHLLDDTVRYESLARDHVPPRDARLFHPAKALGQYLHRPALHHTIGTRLTPSVARELADLGETEVLASPTKPGFNPEMVRLMEHGSADMDWMSALGSSYVKKNLVDNVLSGNASADLHGTSPLPGLAAGLEFGRPGRGKAGY